MGRCQCPAAQQNTKAHLQFVQRLSVFQERNALVGFERTEAWRCVEFIDQWLDIHICRIDLRLKPHAQGLKSHDLTDSRGTLH